MKKLILSITLIFPILIGCHQNKSKSIDGFTINGNIKGIDDYTTVYLLKAGEYLRYSFVKVDSTKIIDGKFNFKGMVNLPEMYYFEIKGKPRVPFFIENTEIKIEGSLKKLNISGSKLHSELLDIRNQIDSLENNDKLKFISTFMDEHSGSYLNPYLILNYVHNLANYEELNRFYSAMDPELTEHRYSKLIKKQLNRLKNIQIGQIAPEFVEKDTLGNTISLNSFTGTYVLVEFWASWCVPCRKENPALVKLYNEQKAKNVNFEIIGVSGDFVEERWKKAIVKDKLPWVNISDLKGFNGTAYQMYGIRALPRNFLLSKEGKIIEKDLTVEELKVKLNKLF